MLLEEFVGLVPALLSALISQLFQVRNSYQRQQASGCEHQQTFWSENIHREYQEERRQRDQGDLYHTLISNARLQNNFKPNFWHSFSKSALVNIAISPAVIVLGVLITVHVYFDINTVDLCKEWQHNNTIPPYIKRWKLIGENIQDIHVTLWFPATLALLVGWQEFKRNYNFTLFISFITEACSSLYKTYLLVFNVSNSNVYNRFFGNIIFLIAITSSCILVAKKFRRAKPSTTYSKTRIILILTFSFSFAFFLSYIINNFIFPYFIHLNDGIYKAMVASLVPGLVLIPTAISKYIALRKSSELIDPDRGFLLPYILQGGAIGLYRTMQADFKETKLFIGLSLLNGLFNVLSKATLRLRMKIWTAFIIRLKRTMFGRNLQLVPLDTPHMRRFNADVEIQNILFESTTLILSQAYLVLYQIQSFEISPWPVIRGSLITIAIGLGIDFFFNNISVFIQIHYYDIPMRRVWFKYWKRHITANLLVLIMLVCYFSPSLWEYRHKQTGEFEVKNCTLPFRSL